MKIGLFTSFSSIVPYYSLSRVVLDQAHMIQNAGHTPVLIACENFKFPAASEDIPSELQLRAIIPVYNQRDYNATGELSKEHETLSNRVAEILMDRCKDLDVIFTHDIIFTGWHLPLNLAIHKAAGFMSPYWFHWIHSIPGLPKRDFWRVPPNGKIVYPNHSDRIRCAENFGVDSGNILVIPHSMDPRNFLMSSYEAKKLTAKYSLLDTEVLQTFPVPTDRMEHKGIHQVIEVLGKLKEHGKTVKLVVVNAWCTTPALKEKVNEVQRFATSRGLNEYEVIFTSKEFPHSAGMDNAVVRDLMLISNLFICPTKSETFGLTIAEAALCGQLLALNANLPALRELANPANALYFTFGSFQEKVDNSDWPRFYGDIARIIAHRMDSDESIKAKTWYRRKYSMDAVWRKIEAAIQVNAMGVRVEVPVHHATVG